MLLAICENKLAIFASTGNYFRPWVSVRRQVSDVGERPRADGAGVERPGGRVLAASVLHEVGG